MNQLDDLDINRELEPKDRPRSWGIWPLVWLAVVLIAAAVWFFFLRRPRPEPPAVPVVSEAPAEPQAPPTPMTDEEPEAAEIVLPTLDESDLLVRQQAGQLSADARWAEWLGNENLIRRFAVAVDNVGYGEVPRRHLRFLQPDSDFSIVERGGKIYIDTNSYRRYDRVASVFASLDTEACARLYRIFQPLIQVAYRDLGYPDEAFDRALARAVRILLATPLVEGEIELTPKVTSYELAEPQLETLSPVQKQLLRMGPGNTRTIQTKLRELARALNLPAS